MSLDSIEFIAPLVNPAPTGLYSAVAWAAESGPPRWLPAGVQFRLRNYGGDAAFGVWGADWCAAPGDLTEDDIKTGERPEDPDPFTAVTVWGYDECDPTKASQAEVRERAQQNLRLQEQTAVEKEFATDLLLRADSPTAVDDLVGAVSKLEAALAETGTTGVIHASAGLAAVAANQQLLVRSGSTLKTPLGHLWVFGGGYVDNLGATLVATSPVFGWRNEVAVREALKPEEGRFGVLAERSVAIGVEAVITAVTITP